MANRLLKRASVTYTPGTPGRAATPGGWVSVDAARRAGVSISAVAAAAYSFAYSTRVDVWLTGSQRADLFTNLLGALLGSGPTGGGGLGQATGVSIGSVWIPGRPAVPATRGRLVTNSQVGWNGGANSIAGFQADGYVEFEFGPRVLGALVGISNGVPSENFSQATHAFYVDDGDLHIVERGVQVATVPGVNLLVRPRARITRTNGVVTYTVGAYTYQSLVASTGPVFMDALLYAADDYVDTPVVRSLQRGRAVDTIQLIGGIDTRARAVGTIQLVATANIRSGDDIFAGATGSVRFVCAATGTTTNRGSGTDTVSLIGELLAPPSRSTVVVPRFRSLSAEDGYARSTAVYQAPISVDSVGEEPIISYGSSTVFAAPMIVVSAGVSGGVGDSTASGRFGAYSVDAELTDSDGAGWGKSTAIVGSTFFVISRDDPQGPSDFAWVDNIVLFDGVDTESANNISWADNLLLNDEADIFVSVDGDWADLVILQDSASILFDLDVFFDSGLYVSDSGTTAREGGIQVAVNLDTNAVTQYTGFDFLRIVSTPVGSFGVKRDGVYRLAPGGDAGVPIDASVDFGDIGTGDNRSLRIDAVFFAMRTDGQAIVDLVGDDGVRRSYYVLQREPVMRANPARGLVARGWRMQLKLIEATDMTLDSLDIASSATGRRWTR